MDPRPTPSVPASLALTAALVALEGAALAVLGAVVAVRGAVSAPDDRVGAVLAGVLALLVGLALLVVARGLSRAGSWAVAPTVVVQVLLVVVALSAVGGGEVLVGVPLVAAGGLVLAGLAVPTSRAALTRPR